MEDEGLRNEVADLNRRVGTIERAFFGVMDEATNAFVPGLLQTSADTSKRTASMERWMKIAALVGALFVLVAAFPKLAEFIKVAIAAVG